MLPTSKPPMSYKKIAELERQNAHLQAENADEKQRRNYYQDIVYRCCNFVDHLADKSIVCGTKEEPSTELQDTILAIVRDNAHLKAENQRLREWLDKCIDYINLITFDESPGLEWFNEIKAALAADKEDHE